MKVRIGTRGSRLALIQAEAVKSRLENLGRDLEVELKIIKTKGDKILDSPLARIDDKGLFVKEIETALLRREIDMGVHSLKDMPTDQPEGLRISAIPERETPNDAFVSNTYSSLEELDPRSVVGTSSLRRMSQVRHMRPDLVIKDIRGNIDTRLRKLDGGEYDALILAAAGLKRMGFEERIAELLPVDVVVPAVGQGALALETREDDGNIRDLCRLLNHEETRKTVEEERAFLEVMGGGCQVPLGCFACFGGSSFRIRGFIGDLEGKEKISRTLEGDKEAFHGTGRRLARLLMDGGADRILEKTRR